MHWLLMAMLVLLPGEGKADEHYPEELCDDIQATLEEFAAYTELTKSQIKQILGRCYMYAGSSQMDQADDKGGSSDYEEKGEKDLEES